MDYHLQALASICRVCGHRIKVWSTVAVGKKNKIEKAFKISVADDNPQIQPSHLCKSCDADTYKAAESSREVVQWKAHSEHCATCEIYRKQSSGGRPKKKQTIAAAKVKARKQKEKEKEELEAACDLILARQPTCNNVSKLKKVASLVMRDLLSESKEGVVQLPTGGPKLTMTKVVVARVKSTNASKRTLTNRNKKVEENMQIISGSLADGHFQMSVYIKAKKELRDLIIPKIRIPPGHELALKIAMGWSWRGLRRLKRWLKVYNIIMVGETTTRIQIGLLLQPTNLQSIMHPFMFQDDSGTICREAPMVYIPDIVAHIKNTLEHLASKDQLTWDNLPNQKICIKIGGDFGGGTTKFYYQIVNLRATNSCNTTTVFCLYEASESAANLHIALERFIDQINHLEMDTWRGMGFDVYLCGDYEILRKFLGLQGASATCPCLYCTVKKNQLNSVDEGYEQRTLQQISDDFTAVQTHGNTIQAKQKHHSVCDKPFFNIPVEKVCPPALHISLGLWQRFYDLLLRDIEVLGENIADTIADEVPVPSSGDTKLNNYVDRIKEVKKVVEKKRREAEELRDEALEMEYEMLTQALVHTDDPSTTQAEEVKELHNRAKQLDDDATRLREAHKLGTANPLLLKLDNTLASFKVRRQQYHGQAFNGNHVDKCLKQENYNKLLDSIIEETSNLCPALEDQASRLKMDYFILFEKFSACHKGFSASTAVSETDIDLLEENIHALAVYFRQKWTTVKLTPKFHILVHHVVPFMKRVRFALGKFGEQGGEALHHKFNVFGRRFEGVKNAKGVNPNLKYYTAIMEEHLLSIHPEVRALNPEE